MKDRKDKLYFFVFSKKILLNLLIPVLIMFYIFSQTFVLDIYTERTALFP
jgi:hypothetical protein